MSLIQLFEDFPDPRRRQGQRYALNVILVSSILSILCGARSYRDIHRFIKQHLKGLKKLLDMNWERAPAHTTIRDILKNLKKEVLEWYFRQHSAALSAHNPGEKPVVAIDGKALKGSFNHVTNQPIVGLVSAYCVNNQLILGHIETQDNDSELPAVQQLLRGFGVKGSIYTLDALHCQKKR
jgi:hypothetical protein